MCAKRLRIVAADDDEEMRSYYARILPSLGHAAVAVESNGHDLVRQAERFRPDLVITDLKLPRLSAIEALARLTYDIPYIIVSSADQPDNWRFDSPKLMVAYLVKPVAKDQIKLAIDATIDYLAARLVP